jgi:hypothetical protein
MKLTIRYENAKILKFYELPGKQKQAEKVNNLVDNIHNTKRK